LSSNRCWRCHHPSFHHPTRHHGNDPHHHHHGVLYYRAAHDPDGIIRVAVGSLLLDCDTLLLVLRFDVVVVYSCRSRCMDPQHYNHATKRRSIRKCADLDDHSPNQHLAAVLSRSEISERRTNAQEGRPPRNICREEAAACCVAKKVLSRGHSSLNHR
jgi:hypothetical protein